MIFVTVGTHEQQFDRLVKSIDDLKRKEIIKEEVIIQIGFCNYIPQFCTYSKLYPYQEMIRLVHDARIVITHGGPSSFIMPLQIGKTPIVVPRKKEFDEHVNDHQMEFCKAVEERQKNILVVNEIEQLESYILNYDAMVREKTTHLKSNNEKFNIELGKLVDALFK